MDKTSVTMVSPNGKAEVETQPHMVEHYVRKGWTVKDGDPPPEPDETETDD